MIQVTPNQLAAFLTKIEVCVGSASVAFFELNGGPGQTRTVDLPIMRPGERERITLKDALEGDETQRAYTSSSRYTRNNSNVLNEKFPTHLYLDEIQDWHLTKFKSLREKAAEKRRKKTRDKHRMQGLDHTKRYRQHRNSNPPSV